MFDFTKCPPSMKLIEFFPEMGAFEEFNSITDENIIRIAIATADMDSPILRIKDRETMLRSLFEFLRINIEEDEGKLLFDTIFNYKNMPYLNCFGRYLILLHEIDWIEYQSTKQTHDVVTLESLRPQEDKESIKDFVRRRVSVQSDLKSLGHDLKRLEAKIFPDSKSAREVALNEAKKIKTYAEKYAQNNTYI